jgi:hypothetical protein
MGALSSCTAAPEDRVYDIVANGHGSLSPAAPNVYVAVPGIRRKDGVITLTRDPALFADAVQRMAVSPARFHLVWTFNFWAQDTSVESAVDWSSSSGFGTYLDILHSQP